MSFAASSIAHCACLPFPSSPSLTAARSNSGCCGWWAHIESFCVPAERQASKRPSSVPKPNQCGRCGAICTVDPFVQHSLWLLPLPCYRFNDDFFSFSTRFSLPSFPFSRCQFDLVTWSGVINWASDAETTIVFSLFSSLPSCLRQLFHHCASWKAS